MIEKDMIETERLVLRPWREEDAPSLFKYARDPAVGPVAGWPSHKSEEESLAVIRTVFMKPEVYAVCIKPGDEPVGCCALMIGNRSNLGMPKDEAEVGYWIGRPYWGRGLIPEAVFALERRAFCDLNLKRLWCGYFEGNEQSKRVQEKCGFSYHHTNEKIYWEMMDDIRTEHITCLKKEDWERRI